MKKLCSKDGEIAYVVKENGLRVVNQVTGPIIKTMEREKDGERRKTILL